MSLLNQLELRNSRVSGFRDQDVLTLQKILDEEFELEKESIIKHQREKREQAAKQAGLQRKRMMLEKQLREEISEIEKDHRIEFWLTLVSRVFFYYVCAHKVSQIVDFDIFTEMYSVNSSMIP